MYVNSAFSASPICGNIERAEDGVHAGKPYLTYTYTSTEGSAVIVKQDMRVNADGARSAYELNNHGISYLCDGLTAREGANWITRKPCNLLTAEAIASAQIKNNELHFSAQGPELCIFGFHVEGGRKKVKGCSGSVVGGGHGDAKAPLISAPSPNGLLQYFISTTSLVNRHVDVTRRYIDSEKIPFIVIPGGWHHKQVSLGDYAYIYSPSDLKINQETLSGPRGSFAIIADTGPKDKFGEGSIALHQMLVFGKLHSRPAYQKLAKDAHYPEPKLILHPYQDKLDGDIRAKSNINSELWYILFANSANKALDEHSFGITEDGELNGNIYSEGAKAAALLGGPDHIIGCLQDSPHFVKQGR